MKTYIVLLRGVNVGGHHKLPMAELRKLLSEQGFEDIKTYIQSGNVVLSSSLANNSKIEFKIKNTIYEAFGFSVPVLVKTREELQRVFNNCPFKENKKKASYFAIFKEKLDSDLIKIALQKTYPDEEFIIIDSCIYLFCANGYGRSKFNLNYFERLFNTNATARNYNTMVKLLDMAEEN